MGTHQESGFYPGIEGMERWKLHPRFGVGLPTRYYVNMGILVIRMVPSPVVL